MTTLYVLDLRNYVNSWRTLLPTLPTERQQRALSCRKEADSLRIAGAGYLLSLALERAGVPKLQQKFERTPMGKPYLTDYPDIQFSLSHAGTWAVCAVGDAPLGVDLEREGRCTMELARRFFHPDEVKYLESLPTEHLENELCKLWTAKEAYGKAQGSGLQLSQPLDLRDPRFHFYKLEDHTLCLFCRGEIRLHP